VKRTVFVDTNIIIEAHRTGCWRDISSRCDIHIVKSVYEEALSGRKTRAGYIEVNQTELQHSVTIHEVTNKQIADAIGACPELVNVDKGERDLLSFLHTYPEEIWFLTTADKAAVKAAYALGLRERFISLEKLAGVTTIPLRGGYTEAALSAICTECLLDAMQSGRENGS
jgi:hypothetical protein